MRTKIGLKAIAAMPPNSILWDTEVRGLNARRQFSEVVTYSVVYRTLEGDAAMAAHRSPGSGRRTWPASKRAACLWLAI